MDTMEISTHLSMRTRALRLDGEGSRVRGEGQQGLHQRRDHSGQGHAKGDHHREGGGGAEGIGAGRPAGDRRIRRQGVLPAAHSEGPGNPPISRLHIVYTCVNLHSDQSADSVSCTPAL
eukprot:847597-Prorocentrum_minimum.AAC.1